jgi:uncharacterized membrane protein YtjA (UPF0391 family)
MLNWTVTFLIVALMAAVLGFGGIAGEAAWIAKTLFLTFLLLCVATVVMRTRLPPI